MSFRVERSSDRTVIRDVPTVMWAFGSAFVASGLFVLGAAPRSAEWSIFGFRARAAVLVIGAAHLAGGGWTVWRAVETVTTLDHATGDATHAVRRAFGRTSTVTRFRLDEVRAVETRTSKDGDGDPMYQTMLWLAGSRVLALQGSPAHNAERAESRAASVRESLGLPAHAEPEPALEA